ncbi:MAG: phospho-sugar mutase [Flavobacteriales bacterium]|nr:phospho-sugar mutase [Flavobacteriales bacterium]
MNVRMEPDNAIVAKAHQWLAARIDDETRKEIEHWLAHYPAALTEAFYTDLDFGTGGMRGVMGAGSNRINRYTIGIATQGLAQYILAHATNGSVAIAHDSRRQSAVFARVAAEVLSANGIRVFLFDELRPTPLLSYTVRHLGCTAGIVITASHNPPKYNGYKVYWNDGAQVVPPQDKGIITEVRAVRGIEDVKFNPDPQLISGVPVEVEKTYREKVVALVHAREAIDKANDLRIVYTSIHGAGITLVPDVLAQAGFCNVSVVEAQAKPDGDFPTVVSPNPEEKAAMDLALALAEKQLAHLVLGTDPDTDRVGIGVRNDRGEMVLLNGNQAGSLLVYYQLMQRKRKGTLHENAYVAKTIVTSELIAAIAHDFGVECIDTLTGFKYIAEVMRQRGPEFICGGEESYGYLVGEFVRDKDGVISSLVFAEIAAWCMANGTTMWKMLCELYTRYGYYYDELYTRTMEGQQGLSQINAMMENLRQHPPQSLGGSPVVKVADVSMGKSWSLQTGETSDLPLPSSNVLQFFLEDGSKISARPSGTEPKIKFYFSLRSTNGDENVARERVQQIKSELGV